MVSCIKNACRAATAAVCASAATAAFVVAETFAYGEDKLTERIAACCSTILIQNNSLCEGVFNSTVRQLSCSLLFKERQHTFWLTTAFVIATLIRRYCQMLCF